MAWERLAQEIGCGLRMAKWRRLRGREPAGVRDKLWLLLGDELGQAGAVD